MTSYRRVPAALSLACHVGVKNLLPLLLLLLLLLLLVPTASATTTTLATTATGTTADAVRLLMPDAVVPCSCYNDKVQHGAGRKVSPALCECGKCIVFVQFVLTFLLPCVVSHWNGS